MGVAARVGKAFAFLWTAARGSTGVSCGAFYFLPGVELSHFILTENLRIALALHRILRVHLVIYAVDLEDP